MLPLISRIKGYIVRVQKQTPCGTGERITPNSAWNVKLEIGRLR